MKKYMLLLLCISASAAEQTGVTIDTPHSGWRKSKSVEPGYLQEVNYPASSVNARADTPESSLIRGHIKQNQKQLPALLVVNGTAMPLRIDDDNTFARPYIFPPGSNSIEIRNNERTAVGRMQFLELNEAMIRPRIRVLLSWDSNNTDLDLHVITPDGGHAYYGSRVLDNGAALDVDVTTGYGPEIFSMPTEVPGLYFVYVNYYGGYDDSTEQRPLTLAQVTVVFNEGTADERREFRRIPMRKPGELTEVMKFHYP